MIASENTFVSTAVAGQSAADSGSGFLDSEELVCSAGSGVQEDTARAGDYAATVVDPSTDAFWHTNEVFVKTGQFDWSTFVCEFSVGDGGGSGNSAPTASFTFTCTDLSCDFDGSGSSDSDGTISSYDWDFGDGTTATGQTVSHTYASAGDFTVTLTVTDDGAATGTDSQTVSVSEAADISLSANGFKQRGLHKVDLSWSGASSTNVDIYRDGALITTTANEGEYRDNIDNRGSETYVYQVCEAGTSTCSNEATVSF